MNILQQKENQDPDKFYASLKEKLEDTHDFPEDYLYKFIIPNSQEKMTEIYRIFDGMKHTIKNRDSKNGKYISLSINAFVLDADQVIDIYKKVGAIEGIMSL